MQPNFQIRSKEEEEAEELRDATEKDGVMSPFDGIIRMTAFAE